MPNADRADADRYSTGRLASIAGCSVQQVRDLEHLGVIPPAVRRPNGYREFTAEHATALRTYRLLTTAVGSVEARAALRDARALPREDALARIVALHAGLDRARDDALSALRALDVIAAESAQEAVPAPEDSMSITELSAALGVRSSTLRFWEQQGLVLPERSEGSTARRYDPRAVRDARIVAALRAGGYRIPAVAAVLASLRTEHHPEDAREALRARLTDIASRSEALLLAGAEIVGGLLRASASRPPDSA